MTQMRLLLLTSLLLSCTAPAGSGNKKEKLEKLKQEQQKVADQIKSLEASSGDSSKPADSTSGPSKEVSITPVTARVFVHYITTQASVQSDENIDVVPQAQGVYKSVLVTEGQRVRKGQPLARVDDLVLQRGLTQVQTQASLATTVYEKRKRLWDQGIGTEIDYLQSKTNAENLQNQIAIIKQQIAQTVVTSPVNGTVDRVNARLGESASPAAPAFKVVNNAVLKVTAGLSESYFGRVKKGAPVVLTFDEIHLQVKAKVDFVGNSVDAGSRTFSVQTKLRGQPNVKSNMSAIMKIQDYTTNAALVLPVDVIQRTLNGEYVYVGVPSANNQFKVVKKSVKIGLSEGGQVEVKEGLSSGDKVITTGYRGLEEGQNVKTGA